MRIKKLPKIFSSFWRGPIITLLIFSWIFSGWPQIFDFPPGIQRAEASTALTLYQTNTSATTLTNASQLTNSAPSSEVSTITVKVGKSTGWDTLPSKGATSNWAAGSSEPSQLGTGFLWDVTTLESQQILAGNWTPKVKIKLSTGSVVADIHVRIAVYNGGSYTNIIDAVLTAQTINTTATTYSLPATAGALTNLNTGDKIYEDVILKITTNSTNSSTAKFTIYENGGANESIVTPGYQPQPPTLTTDAVSPIAQTTATLNGTITVEGANSTVRGFAYGTNSTLATVIATTTESGSFPTGAFTYAASGLTCNTTYYARAYATNPTDTGLGSIQSFTTSACNPTVTTQAASSITDTSATLNGNITATGGANATVRGFAWGTNSTLSGGDTATTTDTVGQPFGTGAYTGATSGLTCNTTYYARAYATNSSGDGLGSIQSFTTSACTVISITLTSSGTVSYGALPAGISSSTVSAYTQTAKNDGTGSEAFNIKGQNTACPWTLAGTSGTDQYVHEFSTNGGSSWTALTTTYQTLATGIAANGTQNFDLRLTVPSSTACFTQQSADVTIQAVAG